MTTFVILVRGVMPSGRNRLPMSLFREVLEKAGFARVRTYIQSGNAVVDTDLTAREVGSAIRELIKNQIGPDLAVIVRTGKELEEVLEANPFTTGYDLSRVFFESFAIPPPAQKIRELLSLDHSPEKLAFGKNTAYLYIPGKYGRGTLSGGFLEKKTGIPATMRNLNTMKKLAVMAEEPPGEKKR